MQKSDIMTNNKSLSRDLTVYFRVEGRKTVSLCSFSKINTKSFPLLKKTFWIPLALTVLIEAANAFQFLL